MKSVKTLKNIKGAFVLVRTDFNVPLKGTKVLDDTRIKVALPTISHLRKAGAKVILMSHIGRDPEESLKPVYHALKKHLPTVHFSPEVIGVKTTKLLTTMKNGDVLLLENLRSNKGEKANDPLFAKALANIADIYVNEAFPVSHRGDASIVGVPKLLPHYAGFQMEREVKELSKVLKPKRPFLFILGGAKIETKLPILKKFLKIADTVFVGGVLANNFFIEKGYHIGQSKYDADAPSIKPLMKNKKLILPTTVVVAEGKNKKKEIMADAIEATESVFDIGPTSIKNLESAIKKAKVILWNGPMGWYEGGYVETTELLLSMLAKSKAETIIGGGDTSVLVEQKKMAKKFTFVSTGGGATLDFLAEGTLPGIKALK